LVAEVRSVLTERPRVRKWISLDAAELHVRTLATVADVQPDSAAGPALTRNPDNDYVIHLARPTTSTSSSAVMQIVSSGTNGTLR
jgi:hypothetical protein